MNPKRSIATSDHTTNPRLRDIFILLGHSTQFQFLWRKSSASSVLTKRTAPAVSSIEFGGKPRFVVFPLREKNEKAEVGIAFETCGGFTSAVAHQTKHK